MDAGSGDDIVRIDDANGAFTTTKATTIAGGPATIRVLGGSGAETFNGGWGNDVADGNGGADTAFMGKGHDVFIWDPGNGPTASKAVRARTDGVNGAGGNEAMAANANGGHVRFTRVRATS